MFHVGTEAFVRPPGESRLEFEAVSSARGSVSGERLRLLLVERAARFRKKSGREVRPLAGVSPLRGRTFPDPFVRSCKTRGANVPRKPKFSQWRASRQLRGVPVTRPGFEPSPVIKIPWLQCKCGAGGFVRAANNSEQGLAGGEREELLRSKRIDGAGSRTLPRRRSAATPGSARIWGRRPESQGCRRDRPRVESLLAGSPARFGRPTVVTGSAGGEDEGYFALGAGDAGSNPAAGIVPA